MATGTVRLRIDELLNDRGISTAEFCKRTGFAYNTVLSMRRDAYERMGRKTLARICDILDVQPGEVFDYRGPRGGGQRRAK
jgi:DNA-binding Xre family transcriptional regulator